MEKLKLSDAEWKKRLMPEQYRILRQKATERPGTGAYLHIKEEGLFLCAACGQELFSSAAKFDSGSGWPSFWQPVSSEAVAEEDDDSMFMHRTEVLCSRCGSHLGHVFPDGPKPTGQRYCINSGALAFRSKT